jgi:hypothetical protein
VAWGPVGLLTLAGCIAPEPSAHLVAGPIGLSGRFGASSGGTVQATDLGDLGVDGHDTGFLPRMDWDWKGIHLSVGGLFTNRAGNGTVAGTLEIGGTTIPASSPVRSHLDLEVGTAVVTWDLVPHPAYEAALGFGLHLVDLEATVTATATGDRVRTHELMPVPFLAARLDLVDWPVGVGLRLGKLDLGLPGLDLETFDVDAFVEWRAFGDGRRNTGYLNLGYRRLALLAEYDDVDSAVIADFTLEAVTLGLRFHF